MLSVCRLRNLNTLTIVKGEAPAITFTCSTFCNRASLMALIILSQWSNGCRKTICGFCPLRWKKSRTTCPPGPRAEPRETAVLDNCRTAEAGYSARLARVACSLGALGDRLKRGLEGWRYRLALNDAADLSRLEGNRVGLDQLVLWISMPLSGVQGDTAALARVGWAVRPLAGGPGPEVVLSAFLVTTATPKT